MYKIEHKPFGFWLTFSGHIPEQEMEMWLAESEEELPSVDGDFVVFVDMRDLEILPPESQPAMKKGQKLYRRRGMQRSVVILSNEVTAMQFKRIAKATGIYKWERYIDANSERDWKKVGLAWVIDGVDPDKKLEVSSASRTSN